MRKLERQLRILRLRCATFRNTGWEGFVVSQVSNCRRSWAPVFVVGHARKLEQMQRQARFEVSRPCDRKKSQRRGTEEPWCVEVGAQSHPSDKNKGVARVGHPAVLDHASRIRERGNETYFDGISTCSREFINARLPPCGLRFGSATGGLPSSPAKPRNSRGFGRNFGGPPENWRA